MTQTTEEPCYTTIILTSRPPVRVQDDQWPIIATGEWENYDNEIRDQANRLTRIEISVRQHADGRAIVYGEYRHRTNFRNEHGARHRVGDLVAAGADLVSTILTVGGRLCDRARTNAPAIFIAADTCIADLPAQDLD